MPKDMSKADGLSVSLGQFSSAGRKPVNQDFHGAMLPEGAGCRLKGMVFAVADGISSSAISGEASETAIKALLTDYYATADTWSVETAATRVIKATNSWLYGQNTSIEDMNAGRVCTLSALILKGAEAHILHVGDSRIQRVTAKTLERVTTDHRMVLSASESYLGRAIGAEPQVEVDYARLPLRVGDMFLLTTDGVHDFIDAASVQQALRCQTLDQAAAALAQAALDRGSSDNLTVQFVRVDRLASAEAGFDTDLADLPVPDVPQSGAMIDGFRILRPVQSTARSHVFLAQSPTGQKVALKIPASDVTQDADFLQRFALEEWVARRVSSSHVVKAVQVPAARTGLYVVTEWIEGTTLRQWMTDTPKPGFDAVRGIIDQIAKGLRALHRRDMIHQDIRPENIMIDRDGTVKIIDLGSATVAGVEEAAPGVLGLMPGTFQYTAPEYLSGDAVSWRSDQYALGVIAYEMLTGRLPYGTHAARVRSRRDQQRLVYHPARDDKTGVPDWLDAALRRAVHPDPLRRYDALSEFLSDLKQPGRGWKAGRHVPLAERDPVLFWQSVSAILAVICIVLAAN
jgi:serine/threonine protein phosphatase PrpC